MVDIRWQQNTCPICGRTFRVTPTDDVFIPACGCYTDADAGHYPCESCGLKHYYAHEGKEAPERRFVAITDGDHLVATAEGKEAGDALLGEFFVDPDDLGDQDPG